MSYKRMKEKEAQLAAELPEELAEVEGKTHPGVPDDKAQRNFTTAESRIMPAPGGRDFQQAYTCQAVVDCAHQVIVAARATNQSSHKQQAVVMIAETISNTGSVPRRSTKGSIRRRRLLLGEGGWRPPCPGRGPVHRARADAPRQSGSARAQRTHTPSSLPQGTGCGASCKPGVVVSAAPCGWRRWSQSSARSAGPGLPPVPVPRSGEGPGRVVADLHRPQP